MQFDARLEPVEGKLPKMSYRWDPETDILTATCKPVSKGTGMSGTIDLQGSDGAFVVLDVADGTLRGFDIVTWPDDVPEVAGLAAPAPLEEGRLSFPARPSQPGIAAVEVDTALQIDKNPGETVFHIRVGRARAVRPVRVADNLIVELDKQGRIGGLWLLDVPPFPNVESGS